MRRVPKNNKNVEPDSYQLERANLSSTNIKRLKSRASQKNIPERASKDTQEFREEGAIREEEE